jgi:hypothetical protein
MIKLLSDLEGEELKIKRDSIFIGEVIRPSNAVFRYPPDYIDYYTHKKLAGKLGASFFYRYRSILFTLNEDLLADDLLYKSPNYPILNRSYDKDCIDEYNVIKNEYNLGPLLEYLGYKEELTLKDIKRIRRRLFDGKFINVYCEIFGYKMNELGYCVEEPLKNCLERPPFSHDLWRILYDCSDKSEEYVQMGVCDTTDAFKPCVEEGKLKKLRRYIEE